MSHPPKINAENEKKIKTTKNKQTCIYATMYGKKCNMIHSNEDFKKFCSRCDLLFTNECRYISHKREIHKPVDRVVKNIRKSINKFAVASERGERQDIGDLRKTINRELDVFISEILRGRSE